MKINFYDVRCYLAKMNDALPILNGKIENHNLTGK